MADAITLIVLVAAGTAKDPTTVAMASATRDALGGALVDVREAVGKPGDEAALAVETSAHADAVVEVDWVNATHRQAALRLHLAPTGRWIERVISFKGTDAQAERGRTLGFAVASMLPEASVPADSPPARAATNAAAPPPLPVSPAVPPPVAPPPPPETPPREAASPPPASVNPPPSPQVAQGPSQPAVTAPPAPVRSEAPSVAEARIRQKSPRESFAVDLTAVGDVGVSGSGNGLGTSAAAHWFVLPALSLRLGASLRAGTVSAAQATSFALSGSAGIAWHPKRPSPSAPFGIALRVDYLREDFSVTRQSESHSRWMSGVDGLVEADWRWAADVGLLGGLGVEDVFGQTYIDIAGRQVTTIVPLRAVGEAGLRVRF